MKSKDASVGFTLIELLIVVSIIAILAAIAVPNFMDAQVRSKVTRAHADMRTIALGIQCYTVDNNTQPPLRTDLSKWEYVYSYPVFSTVLITQQHVLEDAFLLTTPVAYVQRLRTLKDPFTDNTINPSGNVTTMAGYSCFMILGASKDKCLYDNYFALPANNTAPVTDGTRGLQQYELLCAKNFILHGPNGPQKKANLMLFSIGPSRATYTPAYVYPSRIYWIGADYLRRTMGTKVNEYATHYDPSNGTRSMGMIARFD